VSQLGFYDLDKRLDALSAKGDPLEALERSVAWEGFRAPIEAVRQAEERKSNAGRKPYDAVLLFKVLVLQSLYNLSDEQMEFMIRDRLTFMRFLGLGLEDPVPDATTIWLFREQLATAGLIGQLFDLFDQHLQGKGYVARGGQIVDASIVAAPKQRNTRAENEAVKNGETPEDWKQKPAKDRQKDKDARWTKKHGKSFYGYKNHVGVDKAYKVIRKWAASDAAVHDSQKLDAVLDPSNTAKDVWADSAYRSAETERWLAQKGYREKRQYGALQGPCSGRACVRPPAERHGRQERAHRRHRARPPEDRDGEPGLQHGPAGHA
jgi:IS5 family transposase